MSEITKLPKLKPIVMLYSGGADSALMLKLAQMSGRDPFCILIDYGQKHIEELEFAERQLRNNGVYYQVVTIKDYNVESGLTGEGVKGLYEGVSIYNVPARNTIMLSIAAGIAESKKINEVWIGSDMSDYYGDFPDCKQEYIGKINQVYQIAFSYPIRVIAPLLGFEKEIIIEMLKTSFNIDIESIYTGYREFS
ncbi:MAG: 7-cyano-7-deazaguanine synthase [Vallitaleaceae bacterium]|nr:7-cyano-7-deazaguanine synthase [Vallitaleaceae bacterium]